MALNSINGEMKCFDGVEMIDGGLVGGTDFDWCIAAPEQEIIRFGEEFGIDNLIEIPKI